MEFRHRPVEAERRRRHLPVDRKARTGQRRRAQRTLVHPRPRVAETTAVAVEHLDIGEHVVAPGHRLRPLQVGEAGHHRPGPRLGLRHPRPHQHRQPLDRRVAWPRTQSRSRSPPGRCAPRGVQPPGRRPISSRSRLSTFMWMSSSARRTRSPPASISDKTVSRPSRSPPRRYQRDAGAPSMRRGRGSPRCRPGEPPVEVDRGVDRLHDRVGPAGEASSPHRIGTRLVGHATHPPCPSSAPALPGGGPAIRRARARRKPRRRPESPAPGSRGCGPARCASSSSTTRRSAHGRRRLHRRRRTSRASAQPSSNGRFRLVNFWATWCARAAREMPALDALARERGRADFEVIAIATGRNSADAITRFKEEAGDHPRCRPSSTRGRARRGDERAGPAGDRPSRPGRLSRSPACSAAPTGTAQRPTPSSTALIASDSRRHPRKWATRSPNSEDNRPPGLRSRPRRRNR